MPMLLLQRWLCIKCATVESQTLASSSTVFLCFVFVVVACRSCLALSYLPGFHLFTQASQDQISWRFFSSFVSVFAAGTRCCSVIAWYCGFSAAKVSSWRREGGSDETETVKVAAEEVKIGMMA